MPTQHQEHVLITNGNGGRESEVTGNIPVYPGGRTGCDGRLDEERRVEEGRQKAFEDFYWNRPNPDWLWKLKASEGEICLVGIHVAFISPVAPCIATKSHFNRSPDYGNNVLDYCHYGWRIECVEAFVYWAYTGKTCRMWRCINDLDKALNLFSVCFYLCVSTWKDIVKNAILDHLDNNQSRQIDKMRKINMMYKYCDSEAGLRDRLVQLGSKQLKGMMALDLMDFLSDQTWMHADMKEDLKKMMAGYRIG